MDLKIGESGSFSKTISESDIYGYAGITGDFNDLHVNAQSSEHSLYGERIAHGMLSAGFISTVIGTKMPGEGTIYLSQTLNFKAPVRIGDTVTAIATVSEILNQEKGIYKLNTFCENQYGEKVIDGEAVVKYLGLPANASFNNVKETFYSNEEIKTLNLKKYGNNVLISKNAIFYNPEFVEIGDNVRIDDFTTISGKVVLGNYIHIAQFCGLYGGSEGIYMDDYSGVSSRVSIYATSDDYSGKYMTNPMVPEKYEHEIRKAVYIDRHVVVGTTSVILPGVRIAEGTSVGSMSLVNKSLDAWGIYVGIPAKKIKNRDKNILNLEQKLMKDLNSRGAQPKS